MKHAGDSDAVRLSKEARQAILAHAERAYPAECCGILVGNRMHAERAIEANNLADASRKHDRYILDPLAIVRADRAARADGREVIGFYHSHPDHPAVASRTDAAQAWDAYVYLIVSVNAGKPDTLTAWRKHAGADDTMDHVHIIGSDDA